MQLFQQACPINNQISRNSIKRSHQRVNAAEGGSADSGGSGGAGGGGSSGSGGRGSSDDDGAGDDAHADRLAVNAWLLFGVAAAAMGLFAAREQQKRQAAAGKKQQQRHDDVAALKRLIREVLAEMVTLKSRLAELEAEAGINSDVLADGVEASHLGSVTARSGGGASASSASRHRRKQTSFTGVWRLGGGLLWAQDEGGPRSSTSSPGGGGGPLTPASVAAPGDASCGAGDALAAAGAKLGTDLLLRLSRAVRGGADSLHAEASIDPEAQRLWVHRVLYRASLAPGLRLILAPFGGRGEDAAYTLNPVAGQGLAGFVRRGCPLHAAELGSLAAAVADGERAWGSAALFARGEAVLGDRGPNQGAAVAPR